MARPTIVFDLDGTLVDTAPDLVETLNVILTREGFASVPYETGRRFIGGGARAMLEGALIARNETATPELLDRLFADFLVRYGAHIADKSLPFPGVVAALDELARRDCILAVCTNKTEALSVQLLRTLGLEQRFSAICGQDTFGVRKPHPEALTSTIVKAGGDPSRAAMIGDSNTDIETAKRARLPVVAVDFGYSDRPVADYRPDKVIGHFDDLIGALTNIGALKS